MTDPMTDANRQDVIFVTGPAGAGRTTAIHVFEDFGFEAIVNLPLNLLRRLLDGPPLGRTLVIGIDPRTRGFTPEAIITEIDRLAQDASINPQLLYVDCRMDVLLRRFSETRRRHPMPGVEAPAIGVEQEIKMLKEVRRRADILIDTSELSPHELREQLGLRFDRVKGTELAITVNSFSYKRGAPVGLDMVQDLRFLRNPHWERALRPLDGRDARVADYVREDPLYEPFLEKLIDITNLLLPAYKAEGKSYFSIGLGCTGGQHRSVCVTETLANTLAQDGWQVSIRHRELERKEGLAEVSLGKGTL